MKKICVVCGKEYEVYDSRIGKSRNHKIGSGNLKQVKVFIPLLCSKECSKINRDRKYKR